MSDLELLRLDFGEGRHLRVILTAFAGRARVDVRVWRWVGTELRPSKQGVSLLPSRLRAVIEALERAEEELRRLAEEHRGRG